jgi:hypothetical protein
MDIIGATEEIRNWRLKLLRAIKRRDVQVVETLVMSAPGDISQLVNQPLTAATSSGSSVRYHDMFSLPIVIAAIHGSEEILDIFYRKGADIFAVEAKGGNIVHALCWAAGYRSASESNICKIYARITDIADTNKNKSRLLHAMDKDGLRPVELASRLGTLMLLGAIFETTGVYRHLISESVIGVRVKYDLSDYETTGPMCRRHVTPLNFLRRILDTDIEKEGAMKALQHPCLHKWVRRKFRRYIPFLLFSCFLNLLLVFGFTMSDEFGHDKSCNVKILYWNIHGHYKSAVFYSTMGLEIFWAMSLHFMFWRGTWKVHSAVGLKDLSRPKSMCSNGKQLVSMYIFLVFFSSRSVMVMVYLFIVVCVPDWRDNEAIGTVMLFLRVSIQVQLWWCLLYYIQLLPGIGHLVIGAYRCLGVFTYFLLILAMFFIASAEGIRSVASYYCLGNLGYYIDGYYSTFLMMLNMINPRDLTNHSPPVALILMHVLIVFVIVILLLNFLIALLSEEVGKIEQCKHVIQTITRLNVCLELDAMYSGISDLLPDCCTRKQREEFTIENDEYSI